jgi:hypothetical protein
MDLELRNEMAHGRSSARLRVGAGQATILDIDIQGTHAAGLAGDRSQAQGLVQPLLGPLPVGDIAHKSGE